ncbi:MAG: hypothetical protein ACTHK9_08645 [Nitrobacter sp.]
MGGSLNPRKSSQFLRPLVEMKTIPEIATDSDDARQPGGKIAESDGLDEIIKTVQHGADLCESVCSLATVTTRKTAARDRGASMLCASIGTLSQFFPDIPTLRPGFDSYSSVNLISSLSRTTRQIT